MTQCTYNKHVYGNQVLAHLDPSCGAYATKMMDAQNQSSVTAFVTVEENSMHTATLVKASPPQY